MENRSAAERLRGLLLQLSLIGITMVVALLLFQLVSGALDPAGTAAQG